MIEAAAALIHSLTETGPIGAVVGAILVSLALVVIVYAQTSGIFAARRTDKQQGDFQEKLLHAVEVLTKSEEAVRQDNAALREEVGRLGAQVELLRNQNRRFIELLRAVVEGRLDPASVLRTDLVEVPT